MVVVAARLGHADSATTLRTYAHALKRRDTDAASVLDAVLSRKNDWFCLDYSSELQFAPLKSSNCMPENPCIFRGFRHVCTWITELQLFWTYPPYIFYSLHQSGMKQGGKRFITPLKIHQNSSHSLLSLPSMFIKTAGTRFYYHAQYSSKQEARAFIITLKFIKIGENIPNASMQPQPEYLNFPPNFPHE